MNDNWDKPRHGVVILAIWFGMSIIITAMYLGVWWTAVNLLGLL